MTVSAPSQIATPPTENTWYEEFLKQLRQAAGDTANSTARAAAEAANSTARAAAETANCTAQAAETSKGNGPAAPQPPSPVKVDDSQHEKTAYEAALDETTAILKGLRGIAGFDM